MNRTEHYMVGDHVYVSSGSLSGPATTTAFEIINFYSVRGLRAHVQAPEPSGSGSAHRAAE